MWTTRKLFDVLERFYELVEGFLCRSGRGTPEPSAHVDIVEGQLGDGPVTGHKADQGVKGRISAEGDAFKRRDIELGEKGRPINVSVLEGPKYEVGDVVGVEGLYRPAHEGRREEDDGVDLEKAQGTLLRGGRKRRWISNTIRGEQPGDGPR